MRNFKVCLAFLKLHSAAVILAFIVGGLCIAPFFLATTSPDYRGIFMIGGDGEEHYLARMKEITEGYFLLGNVFAPQGKSGPNISPGGGEAVELAFGLPFGLSAAQAEFASKFFFPFCITLALYALMLTFGTSRAAAVGTAAAVMLANNLSSGPKELLNLLHATAASADFMPYSRPVNPEVSGLWLTLGWLLLYRIFILRHARLWEKAVLAFLVSTALYISIFIYTFFGVFLLLWLAWAAWRRQRSEMLDAFLIGAAGLCGAIPYLVNYHALSDLSAYAESALRQGFLSTHAPVIGLWIPLILALLTFSWPKRFASARPLLFISALSVFILSNQQVLTGHTIQVNHYHWYIIKPLLLIVLGLVGTYAVDRFATKRWLRLGAWSAVVAVCIYNSILIQAASWKNHLPQTLAAQAYAPALSYIGTLPSPSVVWADRILSIYIPVYTNADAPNNDYTVYYLMPQTYLNERLFVEYRLRGIKPENALTTIKAERADISNRLYGVYWRDKTGSMEGIPDSVLEDLAAHYTLVYKQPIGDLMRSLGITVLVIDSKTDQIAPGITNTLKKTGEIEGRFDVYAL